MMCRLAACLIVFLLTGVPVSESGQAIEAPELALDWDGESVEIHSWQVRGNGAEGDWHSLISHSAIGERISQHLAVELPGTQWTPDTTETGSESAETGIHRRWLSSDGAWALDQRLRHSGSPYRVRLSLDLTRIDSSLEPSTHPLRLLLGPGLGETPIEGLGIATRLYSFVEPLVRQDGQTRRVPVSEERRVEMFDRAAGEEDFWVGLNSRYFALLLRPESGAMERIEFGQAESMPTDALPDRYLPWVALDLNVPALAAGDSVRWEFELFSGPKSRLALTGEEYDASYVSVLFHGLWRWMRALSFALLRVLEWLYLLIPSWGLAICLLAVLVRLLLFPLARWALASQQKFSAVQARIQPELARIKATYRGGDQSERILQLYEQHNVSPLAGLKPLLIVLIQIPVFVALFHVLGQAYELRDASFLWMSSLSEPDRLFAFGVDLPFFGTHFNLLPVIMALTTLVTIRLAPAPVSSPAERRRHHWFLALMTVFFFLLFYPFPSGMVLYWTMANLLHIGQAWLSRNPRGPI